MTVFKRNVNIKKYFRPHVWSIFVAEKEQERKAQAECLEQLYHI